MIKKAIAPKPPIIRDIVEIVSNRAFCEGEKSFAALKNVNNINKKFIITP